MYIERVPNRNSPPAVLLRSSHWDHGKIRKVTHANLSKLPQPLVDGIALLLHGGTVVGPGSPAVRILDSRPCGHVAALLGGARQLGLPALLHVRPSRSRDLALGPVSEQQLYDTLDWLARRGYSRDGKRGSRQILVDLLCDAAGRPVSAEVCAGNTATVPAQVDKLRRRFGLSRVVLVGDRGMLTAARIREDLAPHEELGWISALRAPAIRRLLRERRFDPEQVGDWQLARIESPDYPGERLLVCRNPRLRRQRGQRRGRPGRPVRDPGAGAARATGRRRGGARLQEPGRGRAGLPASQDRGPGTAPVLRAGSGPRAGAHAGVPAGLPPGMAPAAEAGAAAVRGAGPRRGRAAANGTELGKTKSGFSEDPPIR